MFGGGGETKKAAATVFGKHCGEESNVDGGDMTWDIVHPCDNQTQDEESACSSEDEIGDSRGADFHGTFPAA